MTALDPIMQAAERLRRVQFPRDGERFGDVYGDCGEAGTSEYKRDLMTLSLFSLSILPKGKRPVALTAIPDDSSNTYWRVWRDRYQLLSRAAAEMALIDGYPVYDSEDDAGLALQWNRIEELIAAAR